MKTIPCERCNEKGYVTCHDCRGDGKVYWPGVQGKNYECPTCHGKGTEKCPECHGNGYKFV